MPDSKPKRIFLIDTMSHVFRAYFAPMGMRQEPLRNSSGQVTQAVFVFTNMLRKLLNDEKPDYIAAVFDGPEKTFRHDAFEAYKANRAEMPDELSSQMPYIVRVCEALSIPILIQPGFEADDIIGTLAKEAAKKKIQTVIVSNDKDMCQLVEDPLIVCMRQNSQNIRRKVPVPPIEWCDEAWVEKKFGVPPSKIIELLGLMGDSVDNIPGAPGIGEKGALKLVLEYGSIEGAMKNAEKVTHKTYRESLMNNQDLIRQSLDLATIRTDVPIKLDLDQLKHRTPDRKLAYELFKELEFNTLTREFADAAPIFDETTSGGTSKATYKIIRKKDELEKLVRALWESEYFSFICDDANSKPTASSFDVEPPIGVAISNANGVVYYVDLKDFEGGSEEAITQLRDLFSNGFLEKVSHDYKRNLAQLAKLDITPEAVKDDTMIGPYLLDSSRTHYELPALGQAYLKRDPVTFKEEDFSESQWRTCENADVTFQLAPVLRKRIEADDLEKLYEEIELPLIPLLFRMELAGMKVDAAALQKLSKHISKELEKVQKEVFKLAGHEFNIGSPKQVGEVLQELNIDTGRKTATGKVSTSKDILAELAETYDLPRLVIEFRELDKLRATYADSLPEMISSDGRIHSRLNQNVATTGRLSSSDPNLQNIPVRTELGREIRRAFVAEKGFKLISADYSQLELRILAHVTRDPVMLEAFKKGEDIHDKTARLVFGAKTDAELKEKRRFAKIVNFGIAYAVEAYGLSQRVGISRAEAKKVIEDYFKTYKGVRHYMDEIPVEARENGFVTSIYGRRRYLSGINDRNFNVRSRAEREAINMPIQGTASDIMKIAMLRADEALREAKLEAKIIMQVHDELLVEAPEKELKRVTEILKHEMENAAKLDVPITVEIGSGDNWMTAK